MTIYTMVAIQQFEKYYAKEVSTVNTYPHVKARIGKYADRQSEIPGEV